MSRPRRRSTVDFDVIVVGARCAGAATAMLLARAGVSVLAIDQARYGSDTLSTHALTLPAVLQLSRWGLLDAVRAAGTPAVSRVVQHYGAERVEVPIRPRGAVDGLYAPRRHVLDRILVDAAIRAGASVRHGVGLREVLVEDGRATGVVLDDGSRVSAGMVVGADGARSATARSVGAAIRHSAPHSCATIYTYAHGLAEDAYVNYFDANVAVGVIPTNAGQANVWMSVPMALLRHGGRRDLVDRYVATVTSRTGLDARDLHGPFRTFPGRPGFIRQWWGPGWALVGDAAYFKDPLSAHGITDALIGAQTLAAALISIAAGAEETKALRSYASARCRLIAPMMAAVEHVASFGWNGTSLQQAHLAMNAAMRAEWEFIRGFDE